MVIYLFACLPFSNHRCFFHIYISPNTLSLALCLSKPLTCAHDFALICAHTLTRAHKHLLPPHSRTRTPTFASPTHTYFALCPAEPWATCCVIFKILSLSALQSNWSHAKSILNFFPLLPSIGYIFLCLKFCPPLPYEASGYTLSHDLIFPPSAPHSNDQQAKSLLKSTTLCPTNQGATC